MTLWDRHWNKDVWLANIHHGSCPDCRILHPHQWCHSVPMSLTYPGCVHHISMCNLRHVRCASGNERGSRPWFPQNTPGTKEWWAHIGQLWTVTAIRSMNLLVQLSYSNMTKKQNWLAWLNFYWLRALGQHLMWWPLWSDGRFFCDQESTVITSTIYRQ